MTQMMTNLTADATILTRDNQIVAFSGEMPLDKFRLLRRVIADDWTAESSQSRIRFVKLPESGLDYMLYSRGSVAESYLNDGLRWRALSCATSGDRAITCFRRWMRRPAATHQSAAIAERARSKRGRSRQPFAFVWLVDDPARLLRKRVAEQLVFWLGGSTQQYGLEDSST